MEVTLKKIYVGNLPFTLGEDEVRQLFEQHGSVMSVSLINDRETGQSRGFGFVEMEDDGATDAIGALNGSNHGGRSLRVDEARPKSSW